MVFLVKKKAVFLLLCVSFLSPAVGLQLFPHYSFFLILIAYFLSGLLLLDKYDLFIFVFSSLRDSTYF